MTWFSRVAGIAVALVVGILPTLPTLGGADVPPGLETVQLRSQSVVNLTTGEQFGASAGKLASAGDEFDARFQVEYSVTLSSFATYHATFMPGGVDLPGLDVSQAAGVVSLSVTVPSGLPTGSYSIVVWSSPTSDAPGFFIGGFGFQINSPTISHLDPRDYPQIFGPDQPHDEDAVASDPSAAPVAPTSSPSPSPPVSPLTTAGSTASGSPDWMFPVATGVALAGVLAGAVALAVRRARREASFRRLASRR